MSAASKRRLLEQPQNAASPSFRNDARVRAPAKKTLWIDLSFADQKTSGSLHRSGKSRSARNILERRKRSPNSPSLSLRRTPQKKVATLSAASFPSLPKLDDVIDLVDDDSADSKPPARLKFVPREDTYDTEQVLLDLTVPSVPSPPLPPWQQVIAILPDAKPEYVRSLVRQAEGGVPNESLPAAERTSYLVEYVLNEMMQGGYIKLESSTKIPVADQGPVVVHGQPSMDFSSLSSFQPTSLHVHQALQYLTNDFFFLAKPALSKLLTAQQGHYALVHDKIVTAIKGTTFDARRETLEEAQFRRINNTFQGMLDNDVRRALTLLLGGGALLQRPRHRVVRRVQDARTEQLLQQERAFAQRRLKVFMKTISDKKQREVRAQQALQSNTAMPCQCCFDEVAIDDMIPCRDEGHLFCYDCIQMQAKTKIFGEGSFGIDPRTKKPVMELLCFHGDGCMSSFLRSVLEKHLPEDYMKKYDEVQYQLILEAANLQDVVECPKCGFKAALDPAEKVFKCPIDICRYESCRECGEAAHIPLRCDEVEKESETKGRLSVEEAISKAKIRNCPKCGKGFIKDDGCNKIRCACGTFVCYICRTKIKGYDHFCQTPHCTHEDCDKCPLWTKQEDDDQRAMREAGLEAANKVYEESLTKTASPRRGRKVNAAPAEVCVNVDDILRGPPKRKQDRKRGMALLE